MNNFTEDNRKILENRRKTCITTERNKLLYLLLVRNKQVCLCPVCKLLWLEDHAQKTQTK